MHLPYPARKDSNAARYAPARRGPGSGFVPPILRRMRLRGGVVLVAVVLGVLYVGSLLRGSAGGAGRRGGAYAEHVPTGNPPAVIVTVLEDEGGRFSKAYLQNVKDNRILYAKEHGMFFVPRLYICLHPVHTAARLVTSILDRFILMGVQKD